MKSFLNITLFALVLPMNFSWAQDVDKVSDKEVETYLRSYVANEVDETLLASDNFKDCYEKYQSVFESSAEKDVDKRNDGIRKCNEEKFAKLTNDQIEDLGKDLKLDAYDKNAAESSKSIREYLSARLEKAIYGDKLDSAGNVKKLTEQKYADHATFYQLYLEQIGKNTLLLASQYCLENFGYENKHNIFAVNKDLTQIRVIKNAIKYDPNAKTFSTNSDLVSKMKNTAPISMGDFLKTNNDKLREYEVCSSDQCDGINGALGPDSSDTNKKNKRSVALIEAIKDASFELANDKNGGTPEVIANNYKFCAAVVIKNMCELYKCNNIYTAGSIGANKCAVGLGIAVSSDGSESLDLSKGKDTRGQVACNLMEQLRSYRKALSSTKEVQKEFLDASKVERTAINGLGVAVYENKNQGSIDNLTSISSSELTGKVSGIKNSADRAAKLEEQCFEQDGSGSGVLVLRSDAKDNPECAEVLAKLDSEDIGNIEADSEAQAALFVKKLDGYQETGEELKEFLIKNGLTEYLSKLEGEDGATKPLSEEELIALIKDDYLTKKNSELDAIKAKFKQEMELRGSNDAGEFAAENNIANATVADIQEHKRRVQTLFQYSNIVSSYLTVTSDDDDAKDSDDSANVTGRRLEIKDSEDDELLSYFEGGTDQSSSSNSTFDYDGVFSAILDDKKKKDDSDKSKSSP